MLVDLIYFALAYLSDGGLIDFELSVDIERQFATVGVVMRKDSLVRYSMFKSVYLGQEIYVLLEKATGSECIAFRSFMQALVKNGYKFNTIKSYAYPVAQFLDYLLVGFSVLGEVSAVKAEALLRAYYSYLFSGNESSSSYVRNILELKPRKTIQAVSAKIYHLAINKFILSVRYHQIEDDLFESKGISVARRVEPFIAENLGFVSEIAAKSSIELEGLQSGSYLRRKPRVNYLGHVPTIDNSDKPIERDSFFPLQHISSLIRSATNYRNAALWSLMAATSLRVSEALQILLEDIDFKNRKVYAVDPKTRRRSSSYRGIDEVSLNKLSWKGRTTKHTLLLEPYGSMFFEYMDLYRKHEYQASYHNFLFQTADGDPLCFSDYSSVIYVPFRIGANKVLSGTEYSDISYSPHSLRHSFCVFFKNFVEHTEGVGLRNSEIKALTGQKTDKAVERYALMKRWLVELKVAFAFVDADYHSQKSFNEHKLGFLKREYQATLDAVAKEKDENKKPSTQSGMNIDD